MHNWTLFKTLNEAFAPSDVNPVFSNQISSLLLTFFLSVSKYEHVGRGCFKIMWFYIYSMTKKHKTQGHKNKATKTWQSSAVLPNNTVVNVEQFNVWSLY